MADETTEERSGKPEKSRMRILAEQYHAGELDRETFIEKMLEIEWHPGRWVLPADKRGLNLAEKNAYYLSQVHKPTIPDSVDEFNKLGDQGLIDLPTKAIIYRRWRALCRARLEEKREDGNLNG